MFRVSKYPGAFINKDFGSLLLPSKYLDLHINTPAAPLHKSVLSYFQPALGSDLLQVAPLLTFNNVTII